MLSRITPSANLYVDVPIRMNNLPMIILPEAARQRYYGSKKRKAHARVVELLLPPPQKGDRPSKIHPIGCWVLPKFSQESRSRVSNVRRLQGSEWVVEINYLQVRQNHSRGYSSRKFEF
jgi:hypothetical protein